ncbi:hypothetical protein [Mycolicibacterium phocaicum]|uniref:hypothetical protein n=1 Tax=Mycolicibacterium phocaicum TaxID=319706 RepID=UPI001F44397E|nr:hypothetical protein [Mycolicibacterium phocaicum]
MARQTQQDPSRCPDLAAVLDGWDGTMTVLMRKRIARHIESCPECESERGRRVSPAALLGAMPFIPAPKELRDTTLADIQLVCWTTDLVDGADPGAGVDPGVGTAPAEERRRRLALPISLAACALLLVAGLVWTLTGPARHGRGPVDSGITAPLETPATTPVSAPPSTPRSAPPPSSAPGTPVPGVSTKTVAPPVVPSQQPQPQQDSPAAEPAPTPQPAPPDHPVSRPGPVTRPPMSVAPPSFEAPLPPTGDAGSGGRR